MLESRTGDSAIHGLRLNTACKQAVARLTYASRRTLNRELQQMAGFPAIPPTQNPHVLLDTQVYATLVVLELPNHLPWVPAWADLARIIHAGVHKRGLAPSQVGSVNRVMGFNSVPVPLCERRIVLGRR